MKYTDFTINQPAIEARWDKDFGDRMNELVFIGQDFDKELLINALNSCLLNETELKDFKNGNRDNAMLTR